MNELTASEALIRQLNRNEGLSITNRMKRIFLVPISGESTTCGEIYVTKWCISPEIGGNHATKWRIL